jgi:hypothetical protein
VKSFGCRPRDAPATAEAHLAGRGIQLQAARGMERFVRMTAAAEASESSARGATIDEVDAKVALATRTAELMQRFLVDLERGRVFEQGAVTPPVVGCVDPFARQGSRAIRAARFIDRPPG